MSLKVHSLKVCSYPFDWIFSSPEFIYEMLLQDFEHFVDKSYYLEGAAPESKRHIYNPGRFEHHSPFTNTEDYDYLNRCVERFRRVLGNPGHKLCLMNFVKVNSNSPSRHEWPYASTTETERIYINRIKELLEARDVKNFSLVCANQTVTGQNTHTIDRADNIVFLEYTTKAFTDGLSFADQEDAGFFTKLIFDTFRFEIIRDPRDSSEPGSAKAKGPASIVDIIDNFDT